MFLQELNVSKPEIATPGKKPSATLKIESKSWSKLLPKDQLLLLAKQKPKLSSGADFTSSDLQVNLTILSTGVPGGTQKEVDHRRTRQQIAPKVKKASIDLLNDRLDTRIAMQKKAQALQQRFNQGHDDENGDDLGDEPKYTREYETFKESSRNMEELDEVDADGSSTSEDEEPAVERADPGVMEAPEWKTRGMAFELGRPRRPVIEDSGDEDQMGANVSDGSEEEDVLGALISTSDLEADELDEETQSTEELMSKELKQTDLSRFLSGTFTKPAIKPDVPASAVKVAAKPPRGISEKEKRVRSAFFEEEAEDEDEEELRDEEGMDEAAIEAELAQSKFIIAQGDNEENEEVDEVHHLDVHRALMKADDDRALDQVLMKFARDKTLHGPASLARLDSKYNKEENSGDEDPEDLLGGPALVQRDLSKRKDAALFKLIEEERSEGDDFDLDDDKSLSEDMEHEDLGDNVDYDEDQQDYEDETPLADSLPQERLEDSLASLFSHSHSARPTTNSLPSTSTTTAGTKRAMGALDAERRARLLAQDEDEQQAAVLKGGAFKKIKK